MSELATIPVVPTPPTVPDAAPTIGDFAKVTNNGPATLNIPYDSRPWKVAPGETTIVPFPVVCLYFGDPRSDVGMQRLVDEIDRVTFVPDRDTEVRRLQLLHDVQLDNDGKFRVAQADTQPGDHVAPNVTVTDLADKPITTVLQDPAGVSTQEIKVIPEQEQLRAMLAQQQRQIDELNAKLAQTDPSFTPLTPSLATHVDQASGVSYISTVQSTPGDSPDNPVDLTAETEPPAPPATTADVPLDQPPADNA